MSLREFLQREGRFEHEGDDSETSWLEVGELELSGPLWIGDPCTVSRRYGLVVQLSPGSYRVEGRGIIDDQGYPRVSRLRAVRDDARGFTLDEKLGDCGTDTATIALCDIDDVERVSDEAGAEEIRQRAIDLMDEGCGAVELYAQGEMLRLVLSSTGYGDGTFPVRALVSGARKVGVEVQFIE